MSRTRADTFDVAVVASDPAGLAAALDCARIGLRVVVWEIPGPPVGDEHSAIGGIVTEFCDDLSVSYVLSRPQPGDENILGIPTNPFSSAVRHTLGWRGAWRVYLDRIMPIMGIGNERSFAQLVTRRLGQRAYRLMIRPRVIDDTGMVEDLDVGDLVPGLAEATSRVGSLTLGVIEMMMADERAVQRVTLTGGMVALTQALRVRLDYLAVTRFSCREVTVLPSARGCAVTGQPAQRPEQRVGDPTDDSIADSSAAGNTSDVGNRVTREATALLAPRHYGEILSDSSIPWGSIGRDERHPTLPAAIQASRRAAAEVRQAVLSHSEIPPIGPVDLGG
jgi:hypothetical protein